MDENNQNNQSAKNREIPNETDMVNSTVDEWLDDDREPKRVFKPEKAAFPMAVLAFFVIGNVWGYWNTIWVLFVIAWIIEEAVHFFRTGKFKMSIYGVALIIFLIAGFGFGIWGNSWLIFVVAWVMDSMFVKEKKKKKQ